MDISFLSTDVPLTKTIRLVDGKIEKSAYAMRKRFTSETLPIKDISELHHALSSRALLSTKPCLLKGTLNRELIDQDRAGSTGTNDSTEWVCLDLDRVQFNSVEEFMRSVKLEDVSYIVQYSSSYKLYPGDNTLSCHVFIHLTKALPAPFLKSWLMHLNLTVPALRDALTLCEAAHALRWTLDITTCQNDKLLYIAEPVFIGLKSPLPAHERIQLVLKENLALPVERITPPSLESLKKSASTIRNGLREAAGLTKLRTTVIKGEDEIQTGVGEAHYEVVAISDDFVYFNLNGGDSRGYYHPVNNFEIMRNFKGEPFFYIKEVLPGYYREQVALRRAASLAPRPDGLLLLAFRDKLSSKYWVGTWDESTQILDIDKVDNRDMLEDFQLSHGVTPGEFVPTWKMIYNTQDLVRVRPDEHVINMFTPSQYMREENQRKGKWPTINKLITSVVGEGPLYEHHLDWLAYIFQSRKKAEVAWVLQGTYGSGKGMYVNAVIAQLLGRGNVHSMRASELSEQWNSYLEHTLLVFIDEIEADMFANPKMVDSNMKNYITDSPLTIRKMRQNAFMAPNYTNFIFSSNNVRQPVKIPIGDRRYNLGRFQPKNFEPTDEEVDAIKSDEELSAFAYTLQHRKTNAKSARTIMQTAERQAVQELSINSIEKTAHDLLTGNFNGMVELMPDDTVMSENYVAASFAALVKRFAYEGLSKITRDELAIIFKHSIGGIPEGASKFSRYLAHHGIQVKSIRSANGEVTRGFEVIWNILPEDKEYILKRFPTKLKAVKG